MRVGAVGICRGLFNSLFLLETWCLLAAYGLPSAYDVAYLTTGRPGGAAAALQGALCGNWSGLQYVLQPTAPHSNVVYYNHGA